MQIRKLNHSTSLPHLLFWIIFQSVNSGLTGQNIVNETYTWKNVQIVGGGFVSGIVFHPTAPGIRYCRTDMGGAYRWNETVERWEPMLDWISYEDLNLMGVESIALDPSDPDRLYLACGTYTFPGVPDGAILRSNDRGNTFQRTDVPFKFGGNENGRGNGERMAVDPKNSHILYLGTRQNGLWRSPDRGATWDSVASFPEIIENLPDTLNEQEMGRWYWEKKGSGIITIIFDSRTGTNGMGSSIIYVAVSLMGRNNLYRSVDYGATWQPVDGQPTSYRPTHAVITEDGILYLTYGDNPGPGRMHNGAVWKYNTNTGSWADITPDKPDAENNKGFGYAAVAVDRQNSGTLIVSTYHRYGIDNGEEIFRSTNYGNTWKPVFKTGSGFDYSAAPYIKRTGVHWMFDIEIDPLNPNHALFTTGYGGHETFDLTNTDRNEVVHWQVMSTGIEETVALDLLAPAKDATLITAIGDYGGFVHWDLDQPEPSGNFTNPQFGNTDALALAEDDPKVLVRVGRASHSDNHSFNIGYSINGGRSWRCCKTMPDKESRHGSIAVSSDGKSWIWTPEDQAVYVTHNRGKTWNFSKGIPTGTRVIADRVDPKVFYAMDLFNGQFYSSSDVGNTFKEIILNLPEGIPASSAARGDKRSGQDRLYATPGFQGDIWLPAFDGLYHSTDEGSSFVKIEGVSEIHGFGFGKAAPENDYPALYLVGVVQGVRGFFRSDNGATSWVRINDDQHQYGLVFHITGDPKNYGRVYVGTHGRGILYGDPVIAKE